MQKLYDKVDRFGQNHLQRDLDWSLAEILIDDIDNSLSMSTENYCSYDMMNKELFDARLSKQMLLSCGRTKLVANYLLCGTIDNFD